MVSSLARYVHLRLHQVDYFRKLVAQGFVPLLLLVRQMGKQTRLQVEHFYFEQEWIARCCLATLIAGPGILTPLVSQTHFVSVWPSFGEFTQGRLASQLAFF